MACSASLDIFAIFCCYGLKRKEANPIKQVPISPGGPLNNGLQVFQALPGASHDRTMLHQTRQGQLSGTGVPRSAGSQG